MAEGFKIADAYVEVAAEVDESTTDAAARAAGDRTAKGMSDRIRDSRGKFVPAGESAGEGIGAGAGRSAWKIFEPNFTGGFAGLKNALATNPYVLAAGAGLGATLVTFAGPLITAGISGAVIGAAGLGVIGLGAALLKGEPILVNAGNRLKETFLGTFTTAAEPMLRPLTTALDSFTSLIERSAPLINRMFAGASTAIKPLSEGLIALIENALPGFVRMIEASGPLLASLAPSLGELGTTLSEVFDMFAATGPVAAIALQDLIAAIGWVLKFTASLVMQTALAYSAVRNFFTSIPGWLSAAGAWFTDLGTKIATWATGVGTWIGALPGRFAGWFAGIWATISSWGASVGAFFSALPGQIGGFLASIPGHIANAFVWAFDAATFAVGYGIGAVLGFFAALPGRISSAWSSLVSTVSNFFVNAWNSAKNLTTSGVSAVVSFFSQLPGRVSSAISSLVSRISSTFNTAKSTAASTASSTVSSVTSFFSQLPGRVAGALSGFAGAVGRALSGAVGQATQIGSQIISGLIGGINSMIGAAVSAAKRAVGNIIDGAKSALDIGSPSKRAAKEIGRWIPPGITQGVIKAMPQAKRDIASAVGGVLPPVQGEASFGVAASGAGMGGSMISIGTITLDASKIKDIQDLINMINGLQTTARARYARTAATPGM